MSFDTKHADYDKGSESVLIPFEQGDVFRLATETEITGEGSS